MRLVLSFNTKTIARLIKCANEVQLSGLAVFFTEKTPNTSNMQMSLHFPAAPIINSTDPNMQITNELF